MLGQLSKCIVNWQISKNNLTYEERGLYEYAYKVLLNQIVNILIAILIAAIFHAPVPVFVFLISYIPLRSYCGGYHSNTNGGCIVISALLTCFVCWITLYSQYFQYAVYPFIVFGISGLLVFRYAPVPDPNKPLEEKENIHYRFKSRLIWGIEAMICFFCLEKGDIGFVITVSHIILSVMLCLGLIKGCDC